MGYLKETIDKTQKPVTSCCGRTERYDTDEESEYCNWCMERCEYVTEAEYYAELVNPNSLHANLHGGF